jgi:hypothetical protein
VFKERAFRLEKENSELQAQLAVEKTRSNEVYFVYLFPLLSYLFIPQLTALMAERELAFRAGGAELRAKEDEFIRSKKGLEKEMEQLKREIRVDPGQTTTLHGRDKELKNMEVSRLNRIYLNLFSANALP